jgi:hypothetical protein
VTEEDRSYSGDAIVASSGIKVIAIIKVTFQYNGLPVNSLLLFENSKY